jgi:hypothetical protein
VLLSGGAHETVDFNFAALGGRAFIDFTYGAISVGHRLAISTLTAKDIVSSVVTTEYEVSNQFIDVQLIGKIQSTSGIISHYSRWLE